MMKLKRLYFSATGRTKKILDALTMSLQEDVDMISIEDINMTEKETRDKPLTLKKDEVVMIGVPVYAGRIPNILKRFFKTFRAEGNKAIIFVSYGNRQYDDAVVELNALATDSGCVVVGAGAFIGQHAFSDILAHGRPDHEDLQVIRDFSKAMAKKIRAESMEPLLAETIKGEEPIRPYYTPRDIDGQALNFKPIVPSISDERCNQCGICVAICPMQSLEINEKVYVKGACIKCCACVKACSKQAIFFDDPVFVAHREALEINFLKRRQSEWFA